MEKKMLLFICCLFMMQGVMAQQRTIKGKITASGDGLGVPGASVKVEGSNAATQTDAGGAFSIKVSEGAVLIISSVGFQTQRVPVGAADRYDIKLNEQATDLDEVVVTALGISREKRSLGFSTQEVTGDEVNTTNTGNITSSLSGKVSGVQIRSNNGLGASASIVIRGNKSLTGNNQALWVVDGVPVDNSNKNSSNNGYDFGNMAADINPDDIESVNVLKGAAATALYGSRAANGAIIVTTKKGDKKSGVGITVNSSTTFGVINKNTLPEYQTEYGGAYGPLTGGLESNDYFRHLDMNGDGVLDLVTPYDQYAGFGAAYDPNLLVYQWDSYYPESPYYQKASPWVMPEYGPQELFQNPLTLNNSISLAGNDTKTTYRFSYTDFRDKGIVPKQKRDRNSFSFNGSLKLTPKLTATATANYTVTGTQGRNQRGTGSSFSNYMVNIRQYWQPNIDFRKLKEVYDMTKLNLAQFPGGTIDNPFYVIDNNQQSDSRNRFIGNASLSYQLTDWLEVYGRVSTDSYSYIMEEGQADLIRVPARYNVRNASFSEVNYDLMLNYNKEITDKFNLSGVFGTNIRRSKEQSIYNSTSGGLIVKDLYAINNSLANPPAATEEYTRIGVNGYFGSVSLGYDKTYYLDMTGRVDQSSTLPEKNNTYFYPSVAASFVFSELMDSPVLSFGKLRVNYAEVGNDAKPQSLLDILDKAPYAFGTAQRYSVNDTKNNENLKLERTRSWEVGVETSYLNGRISYNASVYNTNTLDQIMPVKVTTATGYTNKFVNAGDVRNRGVEMTLSGKPIVKNGFSWNIDINWSMNHSKIMSLYEGVTNLNLGNFSTDMSLNATIGRPFGEWWGSDFVYVNGKPVINQDDGKYLKSASNVVLGNMNPDWIGGVTNTFAYKNIALKFLVDMQTGGDIYSEDMAIGTRNGLYNNTTGLNDLGNPMRDPISQGGGLLLDGVSPDGAPNTVRTEIRDRNHALGSPSAPSVMFLYDASYIKLREVSLSYTLPSKFVQRYGIFGAQISLIGTNLWIIHKNLPYADPEAGIAGGTLQGFQSGVFPSTRNFGFNLKLNF